MEVSWQIVLELKLYAIYLRGYIDERKAKRFKGKVRVRKDNGKKVRRCVGRSRQEVSRGIDGYGRSSIRYKPDGDGFE